MKALLFIGATALGNAAGRVPLRIHSAVARSALLNHRGGAARSTMSAVLQKTEPATFAELDVSRALEAFELVSTEEVAERGLTARLFVHRATGAEVLSVDAPDANKVYFSLLFFFGWSGTKPAKPRIHHSPAYHRSISEKLTLFTCMIRCVALDTTLRFSSLDFYSTHLWLMSEAGRRDYECLRIKGYTVSSNRHTLPRRLRRATHPIYEK